MFLIQIAALCPELTAVQSVWMSWEGGTEKRGCWQTHDESIIWTVYKVSGPTEPSLADGPCYLCGLNARMVIKVERPCQQPNLDWHQEAGNLNVFTLWSSVAQRASQRDLRTPIFVKIVIHTGRLNVMHTHPDRFVNISAEWSSSA